jgi:hypothetical protein
MEECSKAEIVLIKEKVMRTVAVGLLPEWFDDIVLASSSIWLRTGETSRMHDCHSQCHTLYFAACKNTCPYSICCIYGIITRTPDCIPFRFYSDIDSFIYLHVANLVTLVWCRFYDCNNCMECFKYLPVRYLRGISTTGIRISTNSTRTCQAV